MKLGDIVIVTLGTKQGKPHVVVGGPANGRVSLCYFGSQRWYFLPTTSCRSKTRRTYADASGRCWL